MFIHIAKIPQLRFFPIAKIAAYKYSLSDMSYGDMLLFENNEPKYYLDLFNPIYSDLALYIKQQGVSMTELVDKILQFNASKVTIEQRLFGFDIVSKEVVEKIEIEIFPIAFWSNYKNSFN
jgi:hypothetical protein